MALPAIAADSEELTGTSCTACWNNATALPGSAPTLQAQHFSCNSQRGPLWGKAPVARQHRSSSFGCSKPPRKQVVIYRSSTRNIPQQMQDHPTEHSTHTQGQKVFSGLFVT